MSVYVVCDLSFTVSRVAAVQNKLTMMTINTLRQFVKRSLHIFRTSPQRWRVSDFYFGLLELYCNIMRVHSRGQQNHASHWPNPPHASQHSERTKWGDDDDNDNANIFCIFCLLKMDSNLSNIPGNETTNENKETWFLHNLSLSVNDIHDAQLSVNDEPASVERSHHIHDAQLSVNDEPASIERLHNIHDAQLCILVQWTSRD